MSLAKFAFFLFCVTLHTNTYVFADEDGFYEVMEDVTLGITLAACEADEACSASMNVLIVPVTLLVIIFHCMNGEDSEYECTRLKPKRVVRTGVAYAVGRAMFS